MANNISDTECSKQCAAFRNAQRIQGINPPVGHVDGCPRLTSKRTMGQCTCYPLAGEGGHLPDCPALYPLQRQPGDEKDALTRLVVTLRASLPHSREALLSDCLDLVSEAREEHRRARDSADADFAWLSKAIASRQALPECNSAGGIVIRNEIESLRYDLAKTTQHLLDTQRRMGEVRQQAFREAKAELAENILLLGDAGPVTTETLQRLLEHYQDNFEGNE